MKAIANIATTNARCLSIERMLKSIEGQFEQVNIYNNDKQFNYYDNAKFAFIHNSPSDAVYFTLDDDIIYPKNYVAQTLANLQIHKGSIVCYHGRKLLGLDKNYYTDHKSVSFLQRQSVAERFDVAGTGVCAFKLSDFAPDRLFNSCHVLMSDLIFSLEASINKIPIIHCPHDYGWLQHIENKTGIHETFRGKPTPMQNLLANKIYKLNYPS